MSFTFPNELPTFNNQDVVEQKNLEVNLGDGYKQRLVMGLPANKRLINLNLTFTLTVSRANIIHTFLDARFDDQKSFTVDDNFRSKVIPYKTTSPKFICTRRTRSNITNDLVSLRLTFQEVAVP